MDLDKLIKEAGADKPKQTRPNDAKWQNNAIQVNTPSGWAFLEYGPVTYVGRFHTVQVNEFGFVDGRVMLDELKKLHPDQKFRLVAILEVT